MNLMMWLRSSSRWALRFVILERLGCQTSSFIESKQKGGFVKGRFWWMCPRSGSWYRGTSECTPVPVLGAAEHPPKTKPPFGKPPTLCCRPAPVGNFSLQKIKWGLQRKDFGGRYGFPGFTGFSYLPLAWKVFLLWGQKSSPNYFFSVVVVYVCFFSVCGIFPILRGISPISTRFGNSLCDHRWAKTRVLKTDTLACRNARLKNTSVSKWFWGLF